MLSVPEQCAFFLVTIIVIVTISNIHMWKKINRAKKEERTTRSKYQSAEQNPGETVWHVISGRIHAIGDHLHAQNEQQDRQDKSRANREKFTISALVVAGLAAVASAVFLYFQLSEAREDAKAASESASKLIALAGRQAKAAEAQTRISQDNLIASTRPWVKLDNINVKSLNVLQDQVRVDVSFTYLNIGRSPASHIWVTQKLLVSSDEMGKMLNTPAACSDAPKDKESMLGEALFPGDKGIVYAEFGKPIDEILPRVTFTNGHTSFIIAGCVVYTFEGSNDVHLTSFFFHLNRSQNHPEILAAGNPTYTFDIFHREAITLDGLQWTEEPFGRFAN